MEHGRTMKRDSMSAPKRREGRGFNSDETVKRNKIDSLESCFDSPQDTVHEVVNYEPPSLSGAHYDPDTTEPISSALNSLEDLRSWQRSQASPFNVAAEPLAGRLPPLTRRRGRTLVCHDMMGGYLEDRFIQGAEVETPYAFYHWHHIDIFNYFSHFMVTIPPAVWTNAAHKHGVLVLGTFITEWKDGKIACEDFLKDEESYRMVADKLVQISHCYGFDGWLVNIENDLSEKAVKNLPLFLRYLTDQIHERIPSGQIVWYDSVLEGGELKWQNELNERNRVFFQACDGFFTNYNWTAQSLEWMQTYPVAKERLADIYVGVDVFARGEVVGGKFETNKAMELIRKHGLSAAIFAPGWVYECHEKEEFRANQDRFWGLLADFLHAHHLSCSLPFVSSFCQGFGQSSFWKGKCEKSQRWLNLSAQEVQPLYLPEPVGGGSLKIRGCPQDAWSGGSSLVLEGKIPPELTELRAKILSLHLGLAPTTLVSLTYKPSDGIAVSLEMRTADAELHPADGTEPGPHSGVQLEALAEDHRLWKQFTQSSSEWTSGWSVRCYLLKLSDYALLDIGVSISRTAQDQDVPFHCRIGEIAVLNAEKMWRPLPPLRGVCLEHPVWQRASRGPDGAGEVCLSITLRWNYPARVARHFRVHWRQLDVPARSPILIGRSHATLYRVCGLTVPDPPGRVELLVEPVGVGPATPKSCWGRCVLSYTEKEVQ
ncbi:cytosolic endo-beta-N-acetylglucosaminidase [Brienomyrus brachyistius]|uniref:cytosolic endo-beta-N-acetylglucosaminidase n=1 Tax=Brienomyrus brachyistius TaxID=42636 RepID=UPI0020B3201B|nr:cytosolic endo-beta-N-acetylglucosaminidase [Brienomyrus brachyistius]